MTLIEALNNALCKSRTGLTIRPLGQGRYVLYMYHFNLEGNWKSIMRELGVSDESLDSELTHKLKNRVDDSTKMFGLSLTFSGERLRFRLNRHHGGGLVEGMTIQEVIEACKDPKFKVKTKWVPK